MTDSFTETSFFKDVASHEMSILRDDGLYRHIMFGRPDSSDMRFDLITWPGSLCYTGDMGTFVFSRKPDMFEFFRASPDDLAFAQKRGHTLYVAPSHWAKKLDAVSGNSLGASMTELDHDALRAELLQQMEGWLKEKDDNYPWTPTLTEDLREEVSGILEDLDLGAEQEAIISARDFEFLSPNGIRLSFDLSERNFQKHTREFLWACHAITWGVTRYDQAKETEREAAAPRRSPTPRG
jgi:hypothetical protein